MGSGVEISRKFCGNAYAVLRRVYTKIFCSKIELASAQEAGRLLGLFFLRSLAQLMMAV